MGSPAVSINPLTNSTGFSIRVVTVRQVDKTQGIALAVDQQNVQVTLPIYLARAKGRIPAEGEVWMIDQTLGFWSFAAYVGPDANAYQILSGTAGGRRIELDENGLRYYRADGTLLVDINTTSDTVRMNSGSFINLTLQNGWVNNTSPPAPLAGYKKLPFDSLQLTGNIKNGTSAGGTILANLPVGFRPIFNHSFPVYVNKSPAANSDVPNITVQPNGDLVLFGAAALGTTGQVIFDFICPIAP